MNLEYKPYSSVMIVLLVVGMALGWLGFPWFLPVIALVAIVPTAALESKFPRLMAQGDDRVPFRNMVVINAFEMGAFCLGWALGYLLSIG